MQRSTTATPPKVHVAHSTASGEGNAETPGSKPRSLKLIMIGAAVLVLALLAALPAYGMAHDGRVFRGVSVLGANLGGMNASEARAALSQSAANYPPGAVSVEGSGRNWTFQPADLGVGVDV